MMKIDYKRFKEKNTQNIQGTLTKNMIFQKDY